MAYVLTVELGVGAGEAHSFEDDHVASLGRTADNDVVVKDAAASRSHARVSKKGTRYQVEDLGSANGTQVNGETVRGTRTLKPGDTIEIGEAVFRFSLELASATLEESSGTTDDSASADPGATSETSGVGPADTGDTSDAGPADTGDTGADDPNSTQIREDAPKHTRGAALAARPRAGLASVPDAPRTLTAAERARERRVMGQTSGGRFMLWWNERSLPVRAALALVLLGVVSGGLTLAVQQARAHMVPPVPEPMDLTPNGEPLQASFGLGDGIDFETGDQKTFSVSTASPTRMVGVLHYQARGVGKDEVTVSLNGVDLGTVPPDTIDADTRELDLVLPAASIQRAPAINTLIFDNVLNPPGKDPWRLWNVWVELTPVPEMSADEAGRRASENIDRAQALAERRNIGAANLFSAWKAYREAWLLLEATPQHSVELHTLARSRVRELRPELDLKCNAMIVDYKKSISQRPIDLKRARAILDDVPKYFPTREHPCFSFSRALLQDLDDLMP